MRAYTFIAPDGTTFDYMAEVDSIHNSGAIVLTNSHAPSKIISSNSKVTEVVAVISPTGYRSYSYKELNLETNSRKKLIVPGQLVN